MQLRVAKDFFSIKEILEIQLKEDNIIDKNAKLTSENFENKKYEGILKLDKNLREENTLHDNEEFNVFGYSPDFLFYKDEKNQEFVIEIESAGEEDKTISITALEIRGKINFKIEGKKIYPKEMNKKSKSFYIHFSVNIERENIKLETDEKNNSKNYTYQDGIYKKAFKYSKVTNRFKNK